MRKVMRFVGIGIVFLSVLAPVGVWAATSKAADKHDCQQAGQSGRFVCDKGPLAGKTFLSRDAMIESLRKESSKAAAQPVAAKPSKASASKKKK